MIAAAAWLPLDVGTATAVTKVQFVLPALGALDLVSRFRQRRALAGSDTVSLIAPCANSQG